ncbi:hypothetical protein L3Y34_011446 [Caenorhabditis briggsae]|uniref:Uncharacterized protein n=1 Tax=Caenorhabditis briggsae TaxID=6238 RepID=A0AAE8ZWB4_CAEBR|nr:hypothetical protein L3Y34_011446 [Caenorhabditis briggsae]
MSLHRLLAISPVAQFISKTQKSKIWSRWYVACGLLLCIISTLLSLSKPSTTIEIYISNGVIHSVVHREIILVFGPIITHFITKKLQSDLS